jgi:hypothetical protein
MAGALHPNRLAGGCQCGTVRYEITGEPVALYVCQSTTQDCPFRAYENT